MKCAACEARKGKRQCQRHQAVICSQCCGQQREASACAGCGFYKAEARNYDQLPRFTPGEMEASDRLQEISFPVEASVCSLDRAKGFALRDADAIAIFECLLDLYAFGDTPDALADRIATLGCVAVIETCEEALASYDRSTITQVLATVRQMAVKRNHGSRDHLQVLHTY